MSSLLFGGNATRFDRYDGSRVVTTLNAYIITQRAASSSGRQASLARRAL